MICVTIHYRFFFPLIPSIATSFSRSFGELDFLVIWWFYVRLTVWYCLPKGLQLEVNKNIFVVLLYFTVIKSLKCITTYFTFVFENVTELHIVLRIRVRHRRWLLVVFSDCDYLSRQMLSTASLKIGRIWWSGGFFWRILN